MKKLLLASAFAFSILAASAQTFVGAGVSVNKYYGDIEKSAVKPGAFVSVQQHITPLFSLRSQLSYTGIKAKDFAAEENVYGRPAPFTNDLFSLNVTPVLQLTNTEKNYLSPYVFAGYEILKSRQGKSFQSGIPFGSGIKFSPSEDHIQLFAEAQYLYGLTDGLDGYKWQYSKGKDGIASFQLGIQWKL